MPVKRYSQRPDQVEAVQVLNDPHDPGNSNFREVLFFIGGSGSYYLDDDNNERLEYRIEGRPPQFLEHTQWVVKKPGVDEKIIMSDAAFKAARYEEDPDLATFRKPETCSFCLADPQHTPQGDPPNKLCPVCSAPYTGPPREREYLVLKQAGLVKED